MKKDIKLGFAKLKPKLFKLITDSNLNEVNELTNDISELYKLVGEQITSMSIERAEAILYALKEIKTHKHLLKRLDQKPLVRLIIDGTEIIVHDSDIELVKTILTNTIHSWEEKLDDL